MEAPADMGGQGCGRPSMERLEQLLRPDAGALPLHPGKRQARQCPRGSHWTAK